MLVVLEVTLVSNADSALVALVVSAVMLAVFAFTLVVNELILFALAVILVVFEVTRVSKATSALVALVISAVILVVFEVTRVSKATSALVALVISAVILVVLEVILVSIAASAFVALVISAVILVVFEVTREGNVAMVLELTPPTLFTVVAKLPFPEPVTSPVKVVIAVADITSVPITKPKLVLAPAAVVAPVPPFAIAIAPFIFAEVILLSATPALALC